MVRIKEIGHAVLYVSDPVLSAQWYRDVLGMELVIESTQIPACFLSFGRRDHDLALFKKSSGRGFGEREYNHLAFELDGDIEDFKKFHRRLTDKGVTITATVDHGISYGVYFLDPDDHQLEVFHQRTGPGVDPKAVFRDVGVMATPIELEAIGS